jgi:hypothetical protein
MTARIARSVALLGALSALGACGALENLGGSKKVSPDEFRIVSHAPLAMPPNADLRPPRPGAPRPMEQTPQAEARSIVTGVGGTGAPGTAAGPARGKGQPGAPAAGGPSAGESALLAKVGQSGTSVDPNIRATVNRESRVIADSNRSIIDSLIFWQDQPEPGVLLDPAKEQQRLREAQATGTDPRGGTPTIERRKRGMLEGIF